MRASFIKAAHDNNKNGTSLIRDFMQRYIKENSKQIQLTGIVKWYNKALVKLNFQFKSEYLLQRIDSTVKQCYNIHKKRSDVRVVYGAGLENQ